MANRIRLNYCGMDGEGRTVTQAKCDAAGKIRTLLSGDWQARCIYGRRILTFVWRDINGWCYKIIDPADANGQDEIIYGVRSGSLADIDRRARSHMAQWEHDMDRPFEVPTYLTDKRDIGEYLRLAAWQLAYRQARADGLSDTDAHEWACHNQAAFLPAKVA